MNDTHLVVSVSCVQEDRILMVNEVDNGINCWNQPAGHVEPQEAIAVAAIREALEETGYSVELTGIQGIYEGIHDHNGSHYVRVAFFAKALEKQTDQLDPDIIKAQWLPIADLKNGNYTLRSGITLKVLEDLTTAPIVPLSFIKNLFPENH